jgi:hypothetical protein
MAPCCKDSRVLGSRKIVDCQIKQKQSFFSLGLLTIIRRMKRVAILIAVIVMLLSPGAGAQPADSADVYLLTVAPGNESYSIYGHTALRVIFRNTTFDRAYNWGIFDFSTPNFTYRFAKGKLDYMLGAYSYEDFLRDYLSEGRSVWSQKVNLSTAEKEKLFTLINENLKPENIKYRYNFFYDNCATRVRDILAASAADTIIYPVRKKKESFRQLIDPYQKVMPWLDLGADMLLGLQADCKASAADEMFLPIYLKENLSASFIVHYNKREPLLDAPELVLDLPPLPSNAHPWMPQAIFYAMLVYVILVTFVMGLPLIGRITDIVLYFIYSILALLLIFTNFFSDHQALHFNMLILGINPLMPVLLYYVVSGRKAVRLSRIVLFISSLWIPVSIIVGQGINPALIPLVLIIMVRLFIHCEFGKKV